MQKGPATLLLELLQQLVDFILHVLSVLDTLAELADKECSQSGLFMVVLDVHIDHMHWLAGLLFSGVQIFYNLVIDSLFTSEDQVKQVRAVLEPFWTGLDPFISVQHM